MFNSVGIDAFVIGFCGLLFGVSCVLCVWYLCWLGDLEICLFQVLGVSCWLLLFGLCVVDFWLFWVVDCGF